MKDRVFTSRTLPSELTTAINNCCSKRQYVFKYWRKNFAVVNFLVSVPRKFKLLSSCISYGVKKETNIAANKNYWHLKKCLSLFICWLFSVTPWNITQQIFFSEQRNKMVFFLFLYYLSAFVYNTTKISHKHKDLFSFWVDGSGFTYKQKRSRFDTRLRQLIVYVVQLG